MELAVPVLVADRTDKLVLPQETPQGLLPSRGGATDREGEALAHPGRAGPHETAVALHQAGLTGLDGGQSLLEADVRQLDTLAVQDGEEGLPLLRLQRPAIEEEMHGRDPGGREGSAKIALPPEGAVPSLPLPLSPGEGFLAVVPVPGLTIAVLAGGGSRRFRTNKLTYRRGGRSVLDRTLGALVPLKGQIFLLVSDVSAGRALAQTLSHAVQLWPDPDPPGPSGPGAAVASALPELPGEWLLVLPGDQPFLKTEPLRRWLETARSLPAGVTSLWEPRLRVEPAFQLHHLREMRSVGRRLRERSLPHLRLSSLLRASPRSMLLDLWALGARPDSFRSLNRPEDWVVPPDAPVARAPERPHPLERRCASLFWRGLDHYRSRERGITCDAFLEEATRHAAAGRWLLSLHALEDAQRLGSLPPAKAR